MKKILLWATLLPAFAFAQDAETKPYTVAGKSFRTQTEEMCSRTTTGGFTTFSHTTMAFTADSVTVTGYRKHSDREQPEITTTHYSYRTAADGIYINVPNQGHYLVEKGILTSDCKYDSGKKYYETASE